MDNFDKLEQLREELHKTLDPKIKEYVQAELDYISEIANGYIKDDLLKAERRLIAVIQSLKGGD